MPHAALLVVQAVNINETTKNIIVSMPHAALLVVQDPQEDRNRGRAYRFNAARGFVGGARKKQNRSIRSCLCFNAARGFVGGARELLPLAHGQY